jgi:hypothetical protein
MIYWYCLWNRGFPSTEGLDFPRFSRIVIVEAAAVEAGSALSSSELAFRSEAPRPRAETRRGRPAEGLERR